MKFSIGDYVYFKSDYLEMYFQIINIDNVIVTVSSVLIIEIKTNLLTRDLTQIYLSTIKRYGKIISESEFTKMKIFI